MEEWANAADVCERNAASWRENQPQHWPNEEFRRIARGLDGAYDCLTRVARECRQVREKGYHTVNVSPRDLHDPAFGEEVAR
jgi:hypothetical protein